MDDDDAVVDLAATAQPLPPGAHGLVTAFGGSRFIDTADGRGVALFASDQLLAPVADSAFIPLDRFQQAL